MNKSLYSDAHLYDLLFPPPADLGTKATFYLDLAGSTGGGPVLELGCGTGTMLLPIAARGIPCEGIDLSEEMLAVARVKSQASGVNVGLRAGDMAQLELRRQFPLIFSASNSLLHLHVTSDLLSCFRSVRRHLQPGGLFAFDVFNPSVRMLASADGVRREMRRFIDPERGEVRVDAAKRYDAEAQVGREIWYFSAEGEPDFFVVSLELRSIFPQELPLLLDAGGLRLLERYGDFERKPFTAESPHQVCVCEAI